jgi:DNA-binding response OmpR family regulator
MNRRQDGDVPKSVLVVDDEPKIVDVVRDYLRSAGFSVSTAADGERALELARARPPDLVVLDLGLPGLDGLDVTRELRLASPPVPIIMLTARGEETDRVLGLELGADDYLVKPFSPRELVARVKAILRRAGDGDAPLGALATFDGGRLRIDGLRHEVRRDGSTVDLTPTEFRLLATLASYPGRVYSRFELLDRVQGTDSEGHERTIDVHVKNLRRKLEPEPGAPRYVQTVHGVGYRLGVFRG